METIMAIFVMALMCLTLGLGVAAVWLFFRAVFLWGK